MVDTGVDQDGLDDRQELGGVQWHGVFRQSLLAWSRAGGDVLVLGSDQANPSWLAVPGLTTRLVTLSAPKLSEDKLSATHPLLNHPHRLNPRDFAYEDSALVPKPENISVAVTVDVGPPEPNISALALTPVQPDQQEGGILLTALAPRATSITAPHIRTGFWVNSFANLAFQHLYLEAGADIPSGMVVASESRVVLVDGREEHIPYNTARVTLWVWL